MELRILIVDDEEIIREGVSNKIKKLVPHANIVGKAQDVNDGLDLIISSKPNIVITDICMPGVDGLEFIKRAREMDKSIKFIVISGFQDFEYARKAISLGVEEYILKPIENDQLRDIIYKIEKQMLEEKNNESAITDLKSEIRQNMDFLKNKYFSDMINHAEEFDIHQIVSKLESMDITFAKPLFTVVCIVISSFEEQSEFFLEKSLPLLKFSIRNIASEILNPLGIVTAFENLRDSRQIVILINHDSKSDAMNELEITRLSREIIFAMNKHFKISISVGIGKHCSKIDDIPGSYMQSYIAVLQRIVIGNNKVISFEKVTASNRITFFLEEEQKMILEQFIKEGNHKRSYLVIDKIFEQIEKENVPYNNIRVLLIDLFLMLSKTVREAGGNWDRIFKEDTFSENYLLRCMSLNDLKNLIKDNIETICHYINDLTKSQGKKAIDEIKEYIDQYYYSEVSLTDLANKYYLNSNYLSQLFKVEVGENFVDYLTRKRIEKSVYLLLNTEFQTYKIAEMVGYIYPRYFYDVFKKILGVTPSQYRQQNGIELN